MAAADPVVLSSSPPRRVLDTTPLPKPCATMSSSPGLPSPSVFFGQKPSNVSQLQSGSKGSPVPKDVSADFASAATILRQSQDRHFSTFTAWSAADILQEPVSKQNGNTGVVPKKRKTKAVKEFDAAAPKQQRPPAKKTTALKNSIADIASAVVIESCPAVVVKNISSTKVKEPAQTKIKRGKVTKAAGVSPELELGKQAKKLKTADRPTSRKTSTPPKDLEGDDKPDGNLQETSLQDQEKATFEDPSLPLGLEETTKRRKEWTPIKSDLQGFFTLDGVETTPVDSQVTVRAKSPQSHFGNLLGDYGFAQITNGATSKPVIVRSASGDALTKRRKVELVAATFGPAPEVAKPMRSKSPKKKYQTVTAKATEQFIAIEDSPNNSLLGYLEPRSGTGVNEKITGKDSSKDAKRGRTMAAAEAKVAKAKPSKSKAQAKLLPPEVLREKAQNQDLLFGTSSQLARDESPTFLREMQHAIKESELEDEPIADDSQKSIAASIDSGSSAGSSLALFTASRSLWSVAARDLEGALQEAEVVDLSATPKSHIKMKAIEAVLEPARPTSQVPEDRPLTNEPPKPKGEWINIEDEPDSSPMQGIDAPDKPSTSREVTAEAEPSIPMSLAEASLRERPKSRSPVKKARPPKEPKEPKAPKTKKPKQPKEQEEAPTTGRPEGMPNYRGFTTTELNEAIKGFGFKAIKKRNEQIGLLERCWLDSQNRMALQPLPANLSLAKPVQSAVEIAPELPKYDSPAKTPKLKLASTADVAPELSQSSPVKKPRGRPPKAKASALPNTEKPAPKPKRRAPKTKAPAASKEMAELVDNETKSPTSKERPPKAQVNLVPEDIDGFIEIDKSSPLKKPRSKKELLATASPEAIPKASIPAKRRSSPPPAEPALDLDSTSKRPRALHLISSPDFDPDSTLPPLDRSTLLSKITEAVTTYPPTHNMKNLTWHEKILLYEPVVLEDLAMWLNLEGLGRMGVDEEVSSGMVKEWCESMSVCCLWRENLRGGVRGRW